MCGNTAVHEKPSNLVKGSIPPNCQHCIQALCRCLEGGVAGPGGWCAIIPRTRCVQHPPQHRLGARPPQTRRPALVVARHVCFPIYFGCVHWHLGRVFNVIQRLASFDNARTLWVDDRAYFLQRCTVPGTTSRHICTRLHSAGHCGSIGGSTPPHDGHKCCMLLCMWLYKFWCRE